MRSSKLLRQLLALACFWPGAWLAAVASSASDENDDPAFFICASINRNYVIGSKIVTTSGVFRLQPDGAWKHIGSNDTTINAVAFDPRDRDVHYTSTLNGCFQTMDGGATWRITTGWQMTEGRGVSVDWLQPDHVYMALPDGIAVSVDAGETWQRREEGLPLRGKYTQTLEIDRTRAGRVLAGCETGIYITEDAARSWRRVLPTENTINDIQQSPHNANHWTAVTQSDGAWESRDGGISWEQLADVPAEHALYNVALDPTDVNRCAIASWTYGVLVSEDGGRTWSDRNDGLPDPHRAWRVGVHPTSGRLYASIVGEPLYYSDDFGRSWQRDALEGATVHAFVTVWNPKSQR